MMADGSANPAGHSSSSQCTESEDSRGEIERQLHEDVLLYLQEQRYRQECTKNEKRCIRRKAMRYTLEDGALLYTKQIILIAGYAIHIYYSCENFMYIYCVCRSSVVTVMRGCM